MNATIRNTLVAAGLVGVVGVAAILPALAQDSTPTDESTEDTSTDREAFKAERHAAFVSALAEELGLPEERVAGALEAVREDLHAQHRAAMRERLSARLDAAVEQGDLTPEQAGAILDAFDAGVFPGRGLGHGPGARHGQRGLGFARP